MDEDDRAAIEAVENACDCLCLALYAAAERGIDCAVDIHFHDAPGPPVIRRTYTRTHIERFVPPSFVSVALSSGETVNVSR